MNDTLFVILLFAIPAITGILVGCGFVYLWSI